MSQKLTIHAVYRSVCCDAPQQLVRSREGGFVSQNCEKCGTSRRVRIHELTELVCVPCDSILVKSVSRISGNYVYTCACCNQITPLFILLPYWNERFQYCGLATPNEHWK
jgi:ribosomal protein S27E